MNLNAELRFVRELNNILSHINCESALHDSSYIKGESPSKALNIFVKIKEELPSFFDNVCVYGQIVQKEAYKPINEFSNFRLAHISEMEKLCQTFGLDLLDFYIDPKTQFEEKNDDNKYSEMVSDIFKFFTKQIYIYKFPFFITKFYPDYLHWSKIKYIDVLKLQDVIQKKK